MSKARGLISMTGFGRGDSSAEGARFTVEAKSVNHRFLEVRVRLPPALIAAEAQVQDRVRKRFHRGSFEVFVRKTSVTGDERSSSFPVDVDAARRLLDSVALLEKATGRTFPVSADLLWQTGRIFVEAEANEVDRFAVPILAAVDTALAELENVRTREGEATRTILLEELAKLRDSHKQMQIHSAAQVPQLREKILERIERMRLEGLDPQRLAWEVAFYADRSDVGEELERLSAHIDAFAAGIHAKEPIGRRLDFLTQEMHREVNTCATKSGSLPLTQVALDAKGSIERLREQVQNVE